VADHVDVDSDAGLSDHAADHRAAGDPLPARTAARAHHDLRHVQRARRVDQRLGDLGPHDLVVRAAELVDEEALALEERGRGCGEPILRDDVDGHELAFRTLRDSRSASDEPLAVRRAGESDEDPLARLPRLVDAVAGAVLRQSLVHPVGEPRECQLPEGGEVAGAEVVREGCVDALWRVDVAAGEPVAERGRGEVDELELVGATHDLVGDRLALGHPRDLFDDVVEGLEVLDVQSRDHVNARHEKLLHILPPLLVPRTRDVRVRELVDERDPRAAGEDCVDVQLLEPRTAVGDLATRDDLEARRLLGRLRPPVRLDEPDDDILAVLGAPASLVQHRKRLAHAGSCAEIDAERPARHDRSVPLPADAVEREIELDHAHARLAEEPQRASVRVRGDEPEHVRP